MSGGNDINNELTLDVSNFTQGIDRATKKLDSLNSKLDKLDDKSNHLQKDLQGLGTSAKTASDKLGAVTTNLDGLAGGLDRVQKASSKASDGSKRFKGDLSALAKEAQNSEAAMSSIGDWTRFYGKALDDLRPKMKAIARSHKDSATITKTTTRVEARAIQNGIQSRIKGLGEEQRINSERIKARKAMISQLELLERRAEASAAFARADAFKTNSKGQEVRRYIGKNSSRHDELMAEISAYKKQADAIRQQKSHISAIVGEMKYRNGEVYKAIKGEQDLLNANKQTLVTQRQQREEATRLKEEKRQAAAQQREQDRQTAALQREQSRAAAQQAKQLAREKASAERQAIKDTLTEQRRAHKETMAMRKEEIEQQKAVAGLAAGVGATAATISGIHQISEYQNTETKVRAFNLKEDEFQRFKEKAWALSSTEKYLSRTDAMQARLDALTAIGYNKEATIDKTVGSAVRNAYIMRSLGYEGTDFSDVVKNLYGFAEARQVMDDPEEINKSFDILRRIAVVSGGKIKAADVETVARNIGDLRQTMSAEGWVRLAAVMEQFKTAGGGNGGGGGVASVGTIFKMMSLYASGKPLTNGAALAMLGADVMNDTFKNGEGQTFESTREANAAFMKAVKFAGFKNTKEMSKDPVKFFTGMRGQLLDYMMQDNQFAKFFGADTEKHTYDKEGRMIAKNGTMVEQREQDDIENAAFKSFFSRMGLSNKAIDGMLLTMNRAFAYRSYKAADSALNSEDEFQTLERLSTNWKANMDALKASLSDFAVTFDPLLRKLVEVPKALSEIIRGLSEFGKENNGVASLALAFLGFKVAVMAVNGPLALLGRTLLLTNGNAKKGAGLWATLQGAFKGAGDKANSTSGAMTSMGNASAEAGKKAKGGMDNVANGAANAQKGVRGFVGGSIRILGTLLSWAGWIGLAAMLGWAIGNWLKDVEVGGLKIKDHLQNLFNDVGTGWSKIINSIQTSWNTFLNAFGADNERVIAKLKQDRKDLDVQHDQMKIKNKAEMANERTQAMARDVSDRILKAKVGEKVQIGDKFYVKTEADRSNQSALSYFSRKNGQFLDAKTKDGYYTAPKFDLSTPIGRASAIEFNKAVRGTETETKPQNEPITTELPPSRLPGQGGHNIQTPSMPGDSIAKKGGRKEFVPQDAFQASLAALQLESTRDGSRLLELMGQPVNYRNLAEAEFSKQWISGQLDDGRDPTSRRFANRAYNKNAPWSEKDINWSDPNVLKWVGLKEVNLRNDGVQKALELAAGKVGESSERLADALEDWNKDTDAQSSQYTAAKRQYSKFEAKNPTATTNNAIYDEVKGRSLSTLAAANYITLAKELRDRNKELNEELLENQTTANRMSEERRYQSELRKIQAVRDSLDEQLKLAFEKGGKESADYQKLLDVKKKGEAEFTNYLEKQNQLRIKNTRSAFDTSMAGWRDIETNFNKLMGDYGERAGNDAWDILNGAKSLDIRGYAADLTRDIGGSLFRSAWGGAAKMLMGEGEGTNLFDLGRGLLKGDAVSEDGMIGRWLNQMRGMVGIASPEKALTGDAATNANTSALTQLTNAIQAFKANFLGSKAGEMTGAVIGAPQNVGAVDVMNGNGYFLDRIFGSGYSNAGTFQPDYSNLSPTVNYGVGIGEPEQQGLFASIQAGFTNLFSSNGEGGIFESVKRGFNTVFAPEGGMMGKIGGSFTGLFNTFGSMLTGLFGGSGTGGKIAGAAGGAMQGFAQGGWGGAVAGGIAGMFSANGNAFDGSGHVQAFANGAAFTNGLYDSPTPFKFANGGGFSMGVMGEAGPEAVMPLQRDSSGRLGVAVNGGTLGGDQGGTNVEISIQVNNHGNSSEESSSGNTQSDWMQMSNRIKSVVQEEIVKQKRPGGMLN